LPAKQQAQFIQLKYPGLYACFLRGGVMTGVFKPVNCGA